MERLKNKPNSEWITQGSPESDVIQSSSDKNSCELKKATRIFRDLTRDLKKEYPELNTPDTWVLRSLIASHFCGKLESDGRTAIAWTLMNIIQCSNPSSRLKDRFVDIDNNLPLFPNKTGFTLADTHAFATILLRYLKRPLLVG